MNKSVFIFLVLFSVPTHYYFPFNFVVWNVGQGLWTTYIEHHRCLHVDMGGEKYPKQVENLCKNKGNQVFLTHLDWDHIGFISRFKSQVKKLCIYYPRPLPKKLKSIKKCKISPKIKILSLGNPKKSKNAGSLVYLLNKSVLISGDSTMAEEKKWLLKVPLSTSILVLGHHGSATSTSKALLKRLNLQTAIASARKSKYGHPHPKVMKKLSEKNVALLKTEIQGHIFMAL